MKKKTFRAWVGFCDNKPYFGCSFDTYRDQIPFDAVTIFKSRTEAKYRFRDVRRCEISIKPVTRKVRK